MNFYSYNQMFFERIDVSNPSIKDELIKIQSQNLRDILNWRILIFFYLNYHYFIK